MSSSMVVVELGVPSIMANVFDALLMQVSPGVLM